MAACQVRYFDPAHVGRVPVDPFGEQAGPASDGWRPCPAAGHGWRDPAGHWRLVCPTHQRQLVALHATGKAGHIRWADQAITRQHPRTKRGSDMAFHSDAHLMLAHESTPPEVHAWQHPQIPDSYTVTIDTADRTGHIALSGNPSQLIDLLGRMTDAVIEVATASGQPPATTAPAEPATSGG